MLSLRLKIWLYSIIVILGFLYFFSLIGRISFDKHVLYMLGLVLFANIVPYFIVCPKCGKSIYRRNNAPVALLIVPEKVCSRCDTLLR